MRGGHELHKLAAILTVSAIGLLLIPGGPVGAEDAVIRDPSGSVDSTVQWLVASPPVLISAPPAEYPKLAERASVSGKLYVNTLIGRDGVPIKTEIQSREPEMAFLFDEAGRRYAMGCRFTPARDHSGEPLSIWVSIPFTFAIPGFTSPSCEYMPVAEYPDRARELGIEGWVGIMVLVDDRGRPVSDQMYVVGRGHPELDIFDEAAKAAVKGARFSPARQDGAVREAWGFLKVEFNLPTG